jgi:hypothetical protein
LDLDDLLEDLWEDVLGDAKKRAGRARHTLARQAKIPEARRRMRSFALWASGVWVTTFGGLGLASELAIDGGAGTAIAIVLGGIAIPAIPTGVWAWRTRERDRSAIHEVQAKRRAKRERDEIPVDVIADWTRLRRAQVLVEDLARQGLVDVDALGEQMAMVGDLRTLLVADNRATDLGAEPSAPARQQVHEVADLLVALAAEAVEHQAEQVGRSGAPATLRDARERLATLRQARNEVDAMDDRAGQANDLIERARADRAQRAAEADSTRATGPAQRPDDDDRGTPLATPG